MRKRLTTREAMVYASEMGQKAAMPEKLLWSAKWWRLHSRDSKNPSEPLGYSRNQFALYKDVVARPEHYAQKPPGLTFWQWSGLQGRQSADDRHP